MEEKMEQITEAKKEEIEEVNDPFNNGNEKILYKTGTCSFCNKKETREKDIVKTRFINVGNGNNGSWLCLSCGNKVSNDKLVRNKFGYYIKSR